MSKVVCVYVSAVCKTKREREERLGEKVKLSYKNERKQERKEEREKRRRKVCVAASCNLAQHNHLSGNLTKPNKGFASFPSGHLRRNTYFKIIIVQRQFVLKLY